MRNKAVIIYTDGASKGNPGPSSVGIVIKDTEGKILDKYNARIPYGTAPSAEYEALLQGIRRARNEFNATDITALSDNLNMVRHINNQDGYKYVNVTAPHLVRKHDEIKQAIDGLNFFHLAHIYRHYNVEADEQANIAFRENKERELEDASTS